MKAAFLKFSNWIKDHLPTKRRLIQVYAALLFNANVKGYISGRIYTGKTKYACVPGMNCYSCPGAVGSCPLGSLQNALASSGNTAPYYVIGILALFGLILGRTICGYLCPVGLGQELLYKLHTPKLKKNKFTRILSYLKYVLLIGFVIIIPILYGQQGIAVPGFCKYVCPAGTFGGGLGLLLNPNNQDYLDMLGPIFTWKFSLLMVIMAACVFCYRSFCRFLCPLGAIYGFFNRFAFIGVHVDKDDCTDCGLCVSHCKMDIKHVGDHECINCGECISVCPTKAISFKGSKLFLHRNEVDGATEQPVLKLSATENSSATDAPVSDSHISDSRVSDAPVSNASAFETPVSDSPITSSAISAQTTSRRPVRIDGYAGLPMPALALENAGITPPALAPDTGLPSGGDPQETSKIGQEGTISDNTVNKATASDKDVSEATASDKDVSEATVSSEDVSEATVSSEDVSEATASDKKHENAQNAASSDKNGQKNHNSDISAGAKLAAAARTPKFWMQCTAVFLALALLIGAFVYFGLQKDAVVTVQNAKIEVYLGTYTESDGAIFVDILQNSDSSGDVGQVKEISLLPSAEGIDLTLTLTYKPTETQNDEEGDDVEMSYSASLTRSDGDVQTDGVYSGTITCDSSVNSDNNADVKNFDGESVQAILKGGRFALQLGNVGRLGAGMLVNEFSLNLYQKDAQGNFALTQNTFDLYDHLGEVIVINFWGTWCGPCVEELPSFELLQKNHPELVMVAIHGEATDAPKGTDPAQFVSEKIKEYGWGEMFFAQDIVVDHVCKTFQSLGGKNAWPVTLIVDRFGVVSFMRQGKLDYATLEAEATKLL